MDAKERERLIKLPSVERRRIIDKLIERVQAIQSERPWITKRPDDDPVEEMSFQEMCGLLDALLIQEELDKPPPWPPELHQNYPQKPGGFRLFLSPNAYTILSESPKPQDKEALSKAIEIALNNRLPSNVDMNTYRAVEYDQLGSTLRTIVEWSTSPLKNDWEGFVFVFAKRCYQLRFFHLDNPEMMNEFFKRCLEVRVC